MSTERFVIDDRALEDVRDETSENIQLDLPHAPTVLIVDDDHLVLAHLKAS